MSIPNSLFRSGIAALLILAGTACHAADIPNLQGSYAGIFQDSTRGTLRSAIIPYIEQDNLRRLTGDLILDGNSGVKFPLAGTIADSGVCTCISSGSDGKVVYQALWEKLGNGAGALFGTVAVTTSSGKSQGTLFLFRPMTVSSTPKPNVHGTYSGSYRSLGSGVTGSVLAQISDGTSNILTLNLAFTTGRRSLTYACTGDVASDGTFVGIGVAADGSVAEVRGLITQDVRGTVRLTGDVQLKTAAGKPIETNSIIAILIG